MGKVDVSMLLSWSDLLGPAGLILVLIGLPFFLIGYLRPSWFWSAILSVNLFANGPRFFGYVILDEVLTGLLIAGAIVRLLLVTRASSVPRTRGGIRYLIFQTFLFYLVVQSVVGIIVLGDERLIRWTIFFLELMVLSVLALRQRKAFPFPDLDSLAWVAVVTITVYLVVYIGQGIIGEILLGPLIGRFLTQDYFFSGSAYALFPLLVVIPLCFHLLSSPIKGRRILSNVALVLMVAAGMYFDSRIFWVVFVAHAVVAGSAVRAKLIRAIPVLLLAIVLLLVSDPTRRLSLNPQAFVTWTDALYDPGGSDAGRLIHLRASLDAATSEGVPHLIVGQGFYTHRYVLVPYVQDRLRWELPPQGFTIAGTRDDTAYSIEVIRTQGISALLVDVGLLGVGLLCLVSLAQLKGLLWSNRGSIRWSFALAVSMSGLWLFTNNIVDILLFYLLLMPFGLFDRSPRPTDLPEVDILSRRRFNSPETENDE